MKPTRVCITPGCPEIAGPSGMCPKCRQESRRAGEKRVGRVRGSRWTKIRKIVLRANPWCACRGCEFCGAGHRVPAVEVDHVIPLKNGGHATGLSNLQGLCYGCHLEKTRGEQAETWKTE